MAAFMPGSVVRAHRRLWRADGQDGDVLAATSIDGGEAEQVGFYSSSAGWTASAAV